MSDWKYDGTTMREVLEWASENVVSISKMKVQTLPESVQWVCDGYGFDTMAHTLYDALFEAWKAREKGGE